MRQNGKISKIATCTQLFCDIIREAGQPFKSCLNLHHSHFLRDLGVAGRWKRPPTQTAGARIVARLSSPATDHRSAPGNQTASSFLDPPGSIFSQSRLCASRSVVLVLPCAFPGFVEPSHRSPTLPQQSRHTQQLSHTPGPPSPRPPLEPDMPA